MIRSVRLYAWPADLFSRVTGELTLVDENNPAPPGDTLSAAP